MINLNNIISDKTEKQSVESIDIELNYARLQDRRADYTDPDTILGTDQAIESDESLSKEKLVQNNIEKEFSLEDGEDDGGSFEEAADDSSDSGDDYSENDNNSDTSSDEGTDMEDDPSLEEGDTGDDMEGGDDLSSDDEGMGDGEADGSEDDDGDNLQGEGSVDKNVGSSLNPFTQVNQKLYLMEKMNELYSSIANAIDKYSTVRSENVELLNLRELLKIVDEERQSFVMQENPENMIKYELYLQQFDTIIQNLVHQE